MGFYRFNIPMLLLLLVLLGAVVPGEPEISWARSLEEIKASGELRVCIAPVTPALAVLLDPQCRDDCSFSGLVYREVMAFVKYLGEPVRPVLHRVEWDEQFHDQTGETHREGVYSPRLLSEGKCDIYPSHVTRNEWRMQKLAFAILFPSRMMVIVHHDRKGAFSKPADLQGKIAAVEKNTSFHTWLVEQNETVFSGNPIVIELMDLEDSLGAVESGKADFTIVDADIALWKASHTFRHLDVAFPVGPVDEIGWAFQKEDIDLRNAAQAFFDSQKDDETSELSAIWKDELGVTLGQFKALIHATK